MRHSYMLSTPRLFHHSLITGTSASPCVPFRSIRAADGRSPFRAARAIDDRCRAETGADEADGAPKLKFFGRLTTFLCRHERLLRHFPHTAAAACRFSVGYHSPLAHALLLMLGEAPDMPLHFRRKSRPAEDSVAARFLGRRLPTMTNAHGVRPKTEKNAVGYHSAPQAARLLVPASPSSDCLPSPTT